MHSFHKKTYPPTFILALSMGILCLVLFVSRAAQSDETPMNITQTIDRNMIRLSDVFADVPSSKDRDLGAAPAPGTEMTIDMRTLMKLATAYGISWKPTSTDDHVTIKRAGILISPDAQQTALLNAITPQIQGKFNLILSTTLTPISLAVGSTTNLTISNIAIDPRNDTFQAMLTPAATPQNIKTITGRIERLVDVPTVRTTIARGTTISLNDLTSIEMKSTDMRGDIVMNADQIVGKSARQNLNPGRLIRINDTEIPVSVKRGQKINLVYKTGQLELTAVGRAMEDGRVGDHIRVTNGSSNKPLQGTVLANNNVEMDE